MSILYNTNSSLIPKFQRHGLIRSHRVESKRSDEFHSQHIKDSDEYLRDLCCSNWPSSLHGRIQKFDGLELSINSFCSLIMRNFLGWYGVKVPTQDEQFPTLLFDLIQDTITYWKKCEMDFEELLCDQLTVILSNHISAMQKLINGELLCFSDYCNLTLYHGHYPDVITKRLKKPLDNRSELQSTFLNALLDDLLLGEILDKVLEPYYLLQALTKLPEEPLDKPRTVHHSWSFQTILDSIASLGGFISRMTGKSETRNYKRPFLYRHIFTFLLQDVLRIHDKKPFLFALFKSLQFWNFSFKPMDKILHNIFQNTITAKIMTPFIWQKLFINLRHTLFPHDTEMGPGTEIPTGETLEASKLEARAKLWKFIQSKRIHLFLGTTQDDVHQWIEILSKDKRCNKLLCFRIFDCVLANLDSH